MSDAEMFEKTFERPSNFFELSYAEQWDVDKALGILDWDGSDLTDEQRERYQAHYAKKSSS